MTKEKYISEVSYSEVSIQESQIVSFNKYDKKETSFRVYKDNFVGVHYQQGEMSDSEGFAKAEKNLELQRPYPFELEAGQGTIDKREKLLTDVELMKKARKELFWLKKNFPDFTFNGNFFTQNWSFAQENSAGMNYKSLDSHNGIGISFKHKDSTDLDDGYFNINMRTYSSTKFRRMAENYLANFTKVMDFPEECIIMMPDWSLTGKIREFLNAENMALGTSQLKVGQKAFSEKLTITHDVSKKNLWMSPFWDADGIVQKNNKLTYINKGKVLRAYADKRIAQKYKVKGTGSASWNYIDIPNNGWIKMKIKSVNKKPKEMLQDLGSKLAIVPVSYSGGGFKENCEYAMPVHLAYLTDGEKILGKLPPFTMKSNLFDLFGKDFIGVSKYDALWNSGMILVKMERGEL
ncbi:MAG: hypothetical protein K5829_02500 [Treponema sp.]|nr:hypothetical protein [Treponema sp.]